MKCKFCDWETKTIKKDGQPGRPGWQEAQIIAHLRKLHLEEYLQFCQQRRKQISKEQESIGIQGKELSSFEIKRRTFATLRGKRI